MNNFHDSTFELAGFVLHGFPSNALLASTFA